MIRNMIICFLFSCSLYCCDWTESKVVRNSLTQTNNSRGLRLAYLLDSLDIRPIAVSDSDKKYIKEYKNIYDEFRFNFDFSKLSNGTWMRVGTAYSKPNYVVQVKNGKKHGYSIIIDEKTGFVRNIYLYSEGKKNGVSISYNMRGIKDGIFTYKNDELVDTSYFLYPNGSIQKKQFKYDGIFRILEYNIENLLIEEKLQYKDSNVTYKFTNGKLVLKVKHDYSRPRETSMFHFDSTGATIRIDTIKN